MLDPNLVPQEWGWRAAFIIGGLLALIIIWVRRYIPESPRWLMTHGRPEEAEAIIEEIETRVARDTGQPLPPVPDAPHLRLLSGHRTSWLDIGRMLFRRYPKGRR